MPQLICVRDKITPMKGMQLNIVCLLVLILYILANHFSVILDGFSSVEPVLSS